VWQAKDFLARVKLARTTSTGVTLPVMGPRTVVIGGGNTALDAAQTLMRLRTNGAVPEVTIVYRRGENEMPARQDEVASARSEGVEIRSWATPIAIIGTADGRVSAVRFLGTRAIRPAEGRRSQIVPIAGSDFELCADSIVFALGYRTELPTLTGVRADKRGLIAADLRRGRTTRDNVWAVGDVVTGPKTVVHAMAAGRRAARDILRALGRASS
jgi:glutamate synthase (NADPH/NADH) small chain